MKTHKNILILGARAPMTLVLVRSFKKQGIRVILADSLVLPIGRWTNAIIKYEQLPSARFNTQAYINTVARLVSNYAITDLIPCCEEAFYIAKYKNKFLCKVWTTNIQELNRLHNKETFAKAFKHQLSIPETISADEFKNWNHSNHYVFKQKYSRFAGNIFNGVLLTKDELGNPEKWIAQKKIHGKEICVYSIWDEGELRGLVCYEPLFRAGKGAGIFFKFIENKEVEAQVKKFGEHLNYTGQLSFDVIIAKDGPWFIECNPRGTSGAHLLENQLADCFLVNGLRPFQDKRNQMLLFLMLLGYPFKFFKKEVRQAKDAIFRYYDPLPAMMQWLSLFEIAYIKLFKRISWLKATTYDIEWNGNES
ncbi:ATP-grasp domain-containing protein [Flavivirga algicola]|uniref:ATP-grasp domain-containing protein n=1 Tax=Flavivirga algicola TaxID=2729136 RepID=A0ABX1RVS8_9FLAO|nr:ATP-grasp domain-containing protein [Flavivirga algicola]NMH86542.1 ATP-grasp domain-containing protein [Flavivirga algicola]